MSLNIHNITNVETTDYSVSGHGAVSNNISAFPSLREPLYDTNQTKVNYFVKSGISPQILNYKKLTNHYNKAKSLSKVSDDLKEPR